MIVTNKTHENELIEFNVNVTVREKTYKIFCSSRQKIRWLIDVAMHKYDRNFAFNSGKLLIIIGLPYAVKLDSNDLCSIEENINTILRNNDHITILLKGKKYINVRRI